MIRYLALWYLQRTFDGHTRVPRWVRTRLERDPILARRWRQHVELDAALQRQATRLSADFEPKQLRADEPCVSSSRVQLCMGATAVVILAVLLGRHLLTAPRTPVVTFEDVQEQPEAAVQSREEQLASVAIRTRSAYEHFRSRFREELESRAADWEHVEQRLETDRKTFVSSLSRLARSVTIKQQ